MAIAIYSRKSVERENSISCETQTEYCRAMLKPDEREEEILCFVDNGFSGGNTDRVGFREMMRLVESGKIRKVIVYRLDRISRSLSDFVKILEVLKKNRVEFVSSQESFDTSGSYGEMIVKILMVFAEFERQSIIERVTQAYAHRSEMGIYMGGRIPYGFSLTECEIHGVKTKMLSPKEGEIGEVIALFRLYSESSISTYGLAEKMYNMGAFNGEHVSSGKISTILRNPIYVRADNSVYRYLSERGAEILSDISLFDGVHGVQLYGRSEKRAGDYSGVRAVVMRHEGAVTGEEWIACQKKLNRNKRMCSAVSNQTSPIAGIVKCKLCSGTMTVTKGGKRSDGSVRRYFSCSSGKTKCDGQDVAIYAESIEQAVLSAAEEIIEKEVSLYSVLTPRKFSESINLLENRISEIESEEEKLVTLILGGAGEKILALLEDRASSLAREKENLISELEKARLSVKSEKPDLKKAWQRADGDKRREILRLIFDSVYITKEGDIELYRNI